MNRVNVEIASMYLPTNVSFNKSKNPSYVKEFFLCSKQEDYKLPVRMLCRLPCSMLRNKTRINSLKQPMESGKKSIALESWLSNIQDNR